MSILKPTIINAYNLSEVWYRALAELYHAYSGGGNREYLVEKGSFENQHKRRELDYFMAYISNPGADPVVPIIPEHLAINPPSTIETIQTYFAEYIMGTTIAENETYTYGSRIALSLEKVIDLLRKTPNTNQAIIEVARPEDIDISDPPCVTPDTLILTIDGYKNAKEVVVGDTIFTHNGNWKKVTKVYKREYIGNLCNVEIKGFKYNLLLTPEHPVYAVSAVKCPWDKALVCKPSCKKRQSAYLKQGYDCKHPFEGYKTEWVDANQLTESHYLAITKIKELRQTKLTNDHMYIFGLFLADGDYNKKDAIRFNLGRHEKELIEKTVSIMEDLYGLNPHYDNSGQGATRISFYSRSLTRFFMDMFGSGARSKHIPFEFVFFEKDKLSSLINGYVDGDGYCRPNKTEFYTSSEGLARMFNLILNKIGIVPSIAKPTPRDTEINGRVIKSNGCGYAFTITNEKHKNKYWEDDDYYFIPITSNKMTPYNGYVFNYEVEDDNSYIANGLTVHNCLRLIDCRVKDGFLYFIIYFRSWDLWAGLPTNLGGIDLLKQYMAAELGIESGGMIVQSKGAHVYDYVWDDVKALVQYKKAR